MTTDVRARERIATDLDTTFVVEASAGTGKTTALVGRIIALLISGRATLDSLAAVTFTEKAAGELKLRLLFEIDRSRKDPGRTTEQSSRLEAALESLERAHISTIHGFCSDLLREHPVEAGVDPEFEVLDESGADELLRRAVSRWFETALEEPPPSLRRFLARRPTNVPPRESLVSMVRSLASCRDHATPWRRPAFDLEEQVDLLFEEVEALGSLSALASEPDDTLAAALAELAWFAHETREIERTTQRDYTRLEAQLCKLIGRIEWKRVGRTKSYGDGILRKDVATRRDDVRESLELFDRAASADLAAAMQSDLQPVLSIYQQLKRQRGALDFLDLLLATSAMLRERGSVREALQERFSHIFVDEFQDTDPLQTEILLLLAADSAACAAAFQTKPVPGKLFVVGDPKQSIYRFRRADVAIYQRAREHLLEQGAEELLLSTSYRAVANIQSVVNSAFAPLMEDEARDQARYVPLMPHRTDNPGQPSIVALPVPHPYSPHGNVTQRAITESLPDALAAFIEWIVSKSGWTTADPRSGEDVPIAARHICLLFRGMVSWNTDLTRPYVRALEARRIPHVLVGGRSFHDREEVAALRAVLNAIEWPDDSLSVYATLRGPFVAIDDATLFLFKQAAGSFNPLRRIDDVVTEKHPEVSAALGLLSRLHKLRNRLPVSVTINEFLKRTRAHASIAIWPTGEQSLANILRVVQQARAFERAGATSFRSFVEWLEARAERGEDSQAPIVEEGSDGIRLMTVHKAKGLEFPVVVLCDPGRSRTVTKPSRYIDPDNGVWAFPMAGFIPHELLDFEEEVCAADNAEEIRVGYVAATRARDLLVVPVVGDDPRAGWVDVLHRSLYPTERRSPELAPSSPTFGDRSVLSRPYEKGGEDPSVAPGLHRVQNADVVWWDPALLEDGESVFGGIRRQELLIDDEEGGAAEAGLSTYHEWRTTRAATIAAGSKANLKVVTATAHSKGEMEAPRASLERTSAHGGERPSGARFGTLVHATLGDISFAATREEVGAHVLLHGRVLGATDDEREAAVESVLAALAHPVMQRAAAAERCLRELPLHHRLPDGTLVEGVADLVFADAKGWSVVDFKTDRNFDRDGYHAQVGLYATALEVLFGRPTRTVLFGV